MSHTPAPWFLGDGGHLVLANSSDCLAILCDTQGDQFASMNTHSVNTVTPEQRRANGLVMAAAPELLNQLEGLCFVARALATSIESSPVIESFIQQKMPAGWRMFLEQLPWSESALKKAKGEE